MTGAGQLALPLGWCQRWNEHQHSWRRLSDGGFDRRRYDCGPIPQSLAREFLACNHYLGSQFPAALHCYGMSDGGQLVGVAVIGVPVRAAVLTGPYPLLIPYEQSAELSRLCLLDKVPANAETYFISRLFRHLRLTTGIRGVVAFSDPLPRYTAAGQMLFRGHWGACYQAANAIFAGRGRARTLCCLPDGTVFNDRARAKILAGHTGWRYATDRLIDLGATAPPGSGPPGPGWLESALLELGATWVRHGGNLRYLFPLSSRVQLGIAPLTYIKPDREGRRRE